MRSSTVEVSQALHPVEMSLYSRLLDLWYRMTAPPAPPIDADFRLQEVARRGRITSLIMLVSLTLTVLPMILESSWAIVLILTCVTIIDFLALYFLNRRGYTLLTGIVITCITEAGILMTITRYLLLHNALTLQIAPFFSVLVLVIIVATPTTGPRFAIGVFFLNCILLALLLWVLPKQGAFALFLQSREGIENSLIVPLSICIGVFFTLMIWGGCTNVALRQADQAIKDMRYSTSFAQRQVQQVQQTERDVREVRALLARMLSFENVDVTLSVSGSNQLLPLIFDLENLYQEYRASATFSSTGRVAAACQLLQMLLANDDGRNWSDTRVTLREVLDLLQPTSTQPATPDTRSLVRQSSLLTVSLPVSLMNEHLDTPTRETDL